MRRKKAFFLGTFAFSGGCRNLGNRTGLQILITEKMTKKFELTKILRKMTQRNMSRSPGL